MRTLLLWVLGQVLRPAATLSGVGGFDPRVSPHAYGGGRVGVIIVDHGSKVDDSNRRLERLCEACDECCHPRGRGGCCSRYAATRARETWTVRPAHMELA